MTAINLTPKTHEPAPALAAHKCRYCGGVVVKASDKCVGCGAAQALAWRGGPNDPDGI